MRINNDYLENLYCFHSDNFCKLYADFKDRSILFLPCKSETKKIYKRFTRDKNNSNFDAVDMLYYFAERQYYIEQIEKNKHYKKINWF